MPGTSQAPCRITQLAVKRKLHSGRRGTMITVNLTMDEAQAVAGAVRELIERSELNEIVLGPIDWDDLRTASGKLTAAIDNGEA